jgi:hypothetical protein
MTAAPVSSSPLAPANTWLDADPASLERALAQGARLAAVVHGLALQLGLPDLGDIELPPAIGEADGATLRAAAPLYLAAELEGARLLPAVETLGGLFASGAITADLGAASAHLLAFWQRRRDRFTVEEREALFGRAFGRSYGPPLALPQGGRNAYFEPLLLSFADALTRVRDDVVLGGIAPSVEVAVRSAAAALATNVTVHVRGMASLAVGELIAAITDALAIVKDVAVQHAVGARTPWGAVRAITQRYQGHESDVEAHVQRARAGMTMLAFLADALPRLERPGPTPLVAASDPVIAAAVSWMQGSLRLEERTSVPAQGR